MVRILPYLLFLVLVSFVTSDNARSEDFSILQEPKILRDSELELASATQLGIEVTQVRYSPGIPSEAEESRETSMAFILRGTGSAKELRGRVCVDHVFLDSPDAKWMPQKRKELMSASSAAFRHLRKMAAMRGIALDFVERQRASESDSNLPVASFSRSLLGQHLSSGTQSWESAGLARCPDVLCDHKIKLVHVAKVGRSFALAQKRDSQTWAGDEVESAVIYLRRRQVGYYYDPEVEIAEIEQVERPAVFAHEVLHLFGAEDLYKPMARKAFAEANYSSDIMLHNDRLLETMTIDAYTSYLIGWSDNPPQELP